MSAMSRKMSLTFVFMFTTGIAHMSEFDFSWTRDRRLDDIIKVKGYPHTELSGDSVVHCASLCGARSSCSSFFFLPTARCLLNEMVFVKPDGSQSSPGARYFKADDSHCPSPDGYVWMRGQRTCIKVHSSPATFQSAYENCTRVGSRLVVLDTRDKLRAVVAYLDDGDVQIKRPYIGAARGGAFNGSRTTWDSNLHPLYWLNGLKVATSGPDAMWRSGNPDNTNGEEGCMEIFNGELNDASCNSHNPFICEQVLN